MKFLRALLVIVLWIVTIPIKLLVAVAILAYVLYVIARGVLTPKRAFGALWRGVKDGVAQDINFIKNGW